MARESPSSLHRILKLPKQASVFDRIMPLLAIALLLSSSSLLMLSESIMCTAPSKLPFAPTAVTKPHRARPWRISATSLVSVDLPSFPQRTSSISSLLLSWPSEMPEPGRVCPHHVSSSRPAIPPSLAERGRAQKVRQVTGDHGDETRRRADHLRQALKSFRIDKCFTCC
ncbi:hypothetical protein DENSPDRAFT_561273 [Dentipellis sp. KUC8613]|nr:hypothetical protein DENSPDRAFT_561273 [Dentipellis sp. KUC8613]